MKVVITPRGFANYGLDCVERMRSLGLEVDYNDTGKTYTHEQFLAKVIDADAVIVGVDDMGDATLAQCSNLKVVCKFGVGTDNIGVQYCADHGIYVGRTVGSNSIAVAELVMALMLADARSVVREVSEVRQGAWNKATGSELYGKTLGLVGFGAIGRAVSRMAAGFGMKVMAYDVAGIPEDAAAELGVRVAGFDEVVAEADYLSLHVPLLDSTRNVIGAAQLEAMKPTACLINAARGGVVDEDALYTALTTSQIASACFDVSVEEPPAADAPLLKLDNFMLTPHVGSRTSEAETRTCEISTAIVLEHLGLSEA